MEFSSVSLKIETVGDREALRALENLDAAGRRIVENVSGKLGRSLGDVASAYDRIGESGKDAFRAMSAGVEIARGDVEKLGAAQQIAGVATGAHGLQLGRLNMELGTFIGRLTGANTAVTRLAAMIGGNVVGYGQMIGALVAVSGVLWVWEKLHDGAKAADETVKDLRDDIKKAQEAMGDLTLARIRDARAAAEVRLANATRDAGRETGTSKAEDAAGLKPGGLAVRDAEKALADINALELAALGKKTEIDAKMRAESIKSFDEALALRISHNAATKQELAIALRRYKAYGDEIALLSKSQTDNVRRDFDISQREALGRALFPKAKVDHSEEKWIADQARILKRYQLEGHQLSVLEASDLANLEAQYRRLGQGLDDLNPKKERYYALEKEAHDLVVRHNADLVQFAAAALEREGRPGIDARSHLLDGIIPTKEQLSKQLHDLIGGPDGIAAAIKGDAMVQWVAESKKLGEESGKAMGIALGVGLGNAIVAGFHGEGARGVILAFGDTILKALGEIFIRQGEALINYSAIMKGLHIALANPITAPWAAAAEGIALIALGTALSAAVSGHGGSGGGGGGGGAYGGGYSTGSLPPIISTGTINPGAYSSNTTPPTARPTISATFNVIGPNDPNAVRGIDEILRRINQRGSLAGAG